MKRCFNQDSSFFLSIGIVKNNADPLQLGRLQVFIPSVDSRDVETVDLPWAEYISPFGGSTANFKVGREQDDLPGISTYGFWAIPKNSAQVLVGCFEGESQKRFWMGCRYQPELNRTLPHSIGGLLTEIDESGVYGQQVIDYLLKNLSEAGLGPDDPNFLTVGGYERSVSYPANKTRTKPTDNGYAKKNLEPENADSQMMSFTTPGRHYMLFSDIDEYCRIRFRTTAGNQVIFDDTNERIYISTARGRNWVELDEGSGHINVYSSSKVNVHSENDINLYSDENINIVAKKRVNIESQERGVKIQGEMGINILSRSADVKITASRDLHLKTLDGNRANEVPENSACSLPPYSGSPLGLTRDYGEEAGSDTSRILINAVENIEIRSDRLSVEVTGAQKVDLRAIGADVTLQAGNNINLRASDITSFSSSVSGFVAIDGEEGPIPIESTQNFGGNATIASEAVQVQTESIVEKMVTPEHESWARTTDEGECETPRNSKYLG